MSSAPRKPATTASAKPIKSTTTKAHRTAMTATGSPQGYQEKLDAALDQTFPASDPVATSSLHTSSKPRPAGHHGATTATKAKTVKATPAPAARTATALPDMAMGQGKAKQKDAAGLSGKMTMVSTSAPKRSKASGAHAPEAKASMAHR